MERCLCRIHALQNRTPSFLLVSSFVFHFVLVPVPNEKTPRVVVSFRTWRIASTFVLLAVAPAAALISSSARPSCAW
jgi:hypothetical protein